MNRSRCRFGCGFGGDQKPRVRWGLGSPHGKSDTFGLAGGDTLDVVSRNRQQRYALGLPVRDKRGRPQRENWTALAIPTTING